MSEKNYVSVNSLSIEDKKKLKNAVVEINDSMIRAVSERDLQKETVDKIAETLGVDKKIVRRMAKAYYHANFNNIVEDDKAFEEMYGVVMMGVV